MNTQNRPSYVACESCGKPYPEETGEPIPHDVMGDPRSTITVCLACAFISQAFQNNNTNH